VNAAEPKLNAACAQPEDVSTITEKNNNEKLYNYDYSLQKISTENEDE
jgi:hypothetical protein